ncbi:MAG: hypothetical protein DRP09_21625 [Candidatus Thorarchaeota archaeon]|nr:MAG: hypothetical protein DRP09_21625 [Candidatus Thorarchaeota archaeon]
MSEKNRLYANIEAIVLLGVIIVLTLLSAIPFFILLYLFIGYILFLIGYFLILITRHSFKEYRPFLVTIFVVCYPLLILGVIIKILGGDNK